MTPSQTAARYVYPLSDKPDGVALVSDEPLQVSELGILIDGSCRVSLVPLAAVNG